MIWSIKYKRTIGDKTYDKVATFISKEQNDCEAYHKWLKQHTIDFIKSIELISIGEKYPKKDVSEPKQLNQVEYTVCEEDSITCYHWTCPLSGHENSVPVFWPLINTECSCWYCGQKVLLIESQQIKDEKQRLLESMKHYKEETIKALDDESYAKTVMVDYCIEPSYEGQEPGYSVEEYYNNSMMTAVDNCAKFCGIPFSDMEEWALKNELPLEDQK